LDKIEFSFTSGSKEKVREGRERNYTECEKTNLFVGYYCRCLTDSDAQRTH